MSKARQCGNKNRHDTEHDAQFSLIENHGSNPQYNVYLCPYCEFWHVGHKIVGKNLESPP